MKTLSLAVLFLAGFVYGYGQSYIPFPTENAEWIIHHYNAGNGGTPSTQYFSYRLEGDTLLNDTLYHTFYYTHASNPGWSALVAGVREENKRVYFRQFGDLAAGGTCIGWTESEVLIYDFNIEEVGDSLYLPTQGGMSLFVAQSIDSVLINDTYRTRWTFMPFEYMCQPFWYTYIEGIGGDHHPFGHIVWMTQEISQYISCLNIDEQFAFSWFEQPPLCDLADYVGVPETAHPVPHCYMSGTTLIFDPAFDWRGARVQLFASNGQRIAEWSQPQWTFDLTEWPSGLYVVRIERPDGSVALNKVVR